MHTIVVDRSRTHTIGVTSGASTSVNSHCGTPKRFMKRERGSAVEAAAPAEEATPEVIERVKVARHVLPGQRLTGLFGEGEARIGEGSRKSWRRPLCPSPCPPSTSPHTGSGLVRTGDEIVVTVPGLLCSRVPRRFWVEATSRRVCAPFPLSPLPPPSHPLFSSP